MRTITRLRRRRPSTPSSTTTRCRRRHPRASTCRRACPCSPSHRRRFTRRTSVLSRRSRSSNRTALRIYGRRWISVSAVQERLAACIGVVVVAALV